MGAAHIPHQVDAHGHCTSVPVSKRAHTLSPHLSLVALTKHEKARKTVLLGEASNPVASTAMPRFIDVDIFTQALAEGLLRGLLNAGQLHRHFGRRCHRRCHCHHARCDVERAFFSIFTDCLTLPQRSARRQNSPRPQVVARFTEFMFFSTFCSTPSRGSRSPC